MLTVSNFHYHSLSSIRYPGSRSPLFCFKTAENVLWWIQSRAGDYSISGRV